MPDKKNPIVTIIIPVLNEAQYIERCLKSLVNNNYDQDKVEILVFDGGSTDATRELVADLSEKYTNIKLLDNPGKYIPPAFNRGIKISKGQVIIRFDGHAEAAEDYIQQNINVLNEHPDAWCAGGPVKTISNNWIGKVISSAMSCPIGVGNAHFRLGNYEGYVDTAMYGAYLKEGLLKVGPVDEFLIRTEDDDLHFRIRKAGGKFYLSQNIRSIYYCRAGISKLWSQYFQYGYWRIPTIIKHGQPASMRQIVPMLFVLGWIALITGGIIWSPLWYVLAAYAGSYLIALLLGTMMSIKKDGFAVGIATPLVFPILHFSYGIGNLAAIWRFLILRQNIPS